jgi:hypothetical protein
VRLGADRRQVVKAISRKHPRHGYHSLIYAEHVKTRGTAAADRYAERTADKAFRLAKEAPRVTNDYEARERLMELYAAVDAEPWPPNLAGARRALEAAYVIAWERGRVAEMKLDERTHAMRAGQSHGAVKYHRKQLHDMGWLRRHARDRGRGISRLTFHSPNIHRKTFQGHPMDVPLLLAHDAWRPAALGDEGWYFQRVIVFRPSAVEHPWDDVATMLQEHGLGIPLPEEELIRRLDLIALDFGTFNTGYLEAQQFLADRARRAEARRVKV